MDPASGSNSTTSVQNTQNSQASQSPVPAGTQEKPGFFKSLGGISKSVGKTLGVEVGTVENTPVVIVNSPTQPIENVAPVIPQPQITATPTQVRAQSAEVNILNDLVFKENPAEFMTSGEDGQLHLDMEKLKKAANKYLTNPENLKKIIEANPHLKEELAGSGIRLI